MQHRLPRAQTVGALVCVLGLLIFAALAPASAAAADLWSWPLDGQHSVVRGFDLPLQPWLAGHRGVDLVASPGQPVHAAGAGTVTFAGWVGGVPAVTVTHPNGLRTTYQPVLASVTRGEDVPRGAILGRVTAGGSHCLPLACLHWGLRRASVYLDPLLLVGGAQQQVRLLPVWSGPGPPSGAGAATALPVRIGPGPSAGPPPAPVALSSARSHLARLGALNHARAAGWAR